MSAKRSMVLIETVGITLTSQSLGNLLIHNDIDADSTLCRSLEHTVQSILLILRRRPAQVQLRGKPPYARSAFIEQYVKYVDNLQSKIQIDSRADSNALDTAQK